MAQACLAVLLQLDYFLRNKAIKGYPLAVYAAENSTKHVEFENVLMQILDAVDYLLDAGESHFTAWLWALKTEFGGKLSPWAWEMGAGRPKAVPLYYVAEFRFCGLVQHIVSKHPQDVNAQGDWGTALHVAVDKGYANVVATLLLAHCVDVDTRGIKGQTPLHLASKKGHVDIGQQLLDRNVDVDAQDNNHSIPLHLALSEQNIEAAKLFVECGANVQVRNNNSQTLLHLAVKSGYHDVQFLLDQGADVDAQDERVQRR